MLIYVAYNLLSHSPDKAFTNLSEAEQYLEDSLELIKLYKVKYDQSHKHLVYGNHVNIQKIELVVDEFIGQVFNLTNQKDTL